MLKFSNKKYFILFSTYLDVLKTNTIKNYIPHVWNLEKYLFFIEIVINK